MSLVKCLDELDFGLVFEESGGEPAAALDVQTLPLHLDALPPQAFGLGPLGPGSSDPAARAAAPVTFDCPSIHITSIAAGGAAEAGGDAELLYGAAGGPWSPGQLYLPPDPSYRERCSSPGSSLSSRSWLSDLSSCESFSHVYDDVEPELCEAAGPGPGPAPCSPGCGGGSFGVELWQQKYQSPSGFSPVPSPSPNHSPRSSVTEESWLSCRPPSRPSSRPSSPCGKRRYSGADPPARSPSPHHSASPSPATSPRGSVTDDTWGGHLPPLGPAPPLFYQELDVPSKTRRTAAGPFGPGGPEDPQPEPDGQAELFLMVPSHYSWTKAPTEGPPLFRPGSPPPLDQPLPSSFLHTELRLEVQPRSFHRAHYETEGSRGAIKAATGGGHPIITLSGCGDGAARLLLFIGTADERQLRPHSFYQVHRVTGKTVTTPCQEKLLGGTKVLEIPLLQENNMSASIDCAGILKLRNADIELRRGETDVGRKNTRVRVVFRAAVPQPDGWTLWLQTVSNPVECSQRSAQELPLVESFTPACCSVEGGVELLISGSNMSAQSRVIFTEKGADGRVLWEVEARTIPDRCSSSSIVVLVPPHRGRVLAPVPVSFHVTNGKRRKSLTKTFTYLPAPKAELTHNPSGLYGPACSLQDPDLGSFTSGLLMQCHLSPQSASPRLCHFPPAPTEPLLLAHAAPHPQQLRPAHPHSLPGPSHTLHTLPPDTFLNPKDFLLPRSPANTVKQEPQVRERPGASGLQEITLDDVNEIIHRDFSHLGAGSCDL